jgi:hypothetical protein
MFSYSDTFEYMDTLSTLKLSDRLALSYSERQSIRSNAFASPYAKISGAIIRRINAPRAKGNATNWHEVKPFRVSRTASLSATSRPALTPDECEEVHQTVALILIQRGVLPGAKLTLGEDGDWRNVFRAVRVLLGIDKRARSKRVFQSMDAQPDDSFHVAPLPAFVDHPAEIRELQAHYRKRMARKFSYARSMAHAAFMASTKRTRRSTYHGAIATLKAHIRAAFRPVNNPLFNGVSDDAKFVRDSRLREYLESGEIAMNAVAITATPQPLTLHAFTQLRVPMIREIRAEIDAQNTVLA